MKKEIVYLRPNGKIASGQVYKGGYDPKTNELFFLELIGMSLEVKGGVKINGKEKFKRLFVQQVYPHIKL